MMLGHLIVTPSLAVAGVAALGAAGVTTWWLVRKRQKRVWLPTIRVMRLESYVLPRLVLRPPPLVGFLCFLAAALVLLGYTLRPRTQVFTPFEPNQTKIHVFCDLSPSVSAAVSIDEYAARMAALYTQLKDSGRVSVSTSAGPQVSEPQSAEEMAELVKRAGFHRSGLRLGTAMKELLAERTDIDRLVVVSDHDAHSWTDFNWQYLSDEMDVVHFDLTDGKDRAARNLFVNDARYLSSPAAPTMDWDVEVARSGAPGEVDGKLDVTYMGRPLGSYPWHLPAGRQRLSVRASWPSSAIAAIDRTGARDVPLVFRLTVDGGDAVALDNEFRAGLRGLKQDVLLVSESAGERALEDPAEQLEVALEIQGFRIRRVDAVAQPGPAPDEYPFVVLLGGGEGSAAAYCPKSLELARLAERGKQGARDGRRRMPKVWLAPQTLSSSYRDLCRCYARLLLSNAATDGEPAFCQGVETRSQWIGLLPSLGARQVGGQVGDWTKALAWKGRDQASGLEVLAFTVPLTPSTATGINHAQMPLLVKDLLNWQGLLETEAPGGGGGWPRIEDVAQKVWHPDPGLEPEALARQRTTNVPLGESLLSPLDDAQLPPRWTSPSDWATKRVPAKKDREDPLPWLKLAAMVVVGVSLFEGLFGIGTRLLRASSRVAAKRPGTGTTVIGALLLSGAFGLGDRAEAKIDMNLLGYPSPITLGTLAREVEHRTSIDLETKPLVSARLSPETLAEPWLWVKDLSPITQSGGVLKPEVATWIKRGGFLILEAPAAPAQLQKLTEALKGVDPADGWQPLPPDHELMRSFYLLDALPACNGEIWRGFHYDGRLAVLAVPYGFLATLKDHGQPPACANAPDQERSVRVFVNLIMVALATDYKKDQIHLPEILKRLR